MKKIILWSVVGILIAGIAVAGFLWLRKPQIITLSDGTKLTLLGVEYGKHHKYPTVKTSGRRTGGGQSSFDTTNDTLVVWILQEHKGAQRYGWQALVHDRAETASAQNWAMNSRQIAQGREISAIQLDAFPRRDSKFFMRVMSYGNGAQHLSKEQFVISNPASGKTFPTWTPDPLPDTQSDGDLDVTLNKLVADAPSPYTGNGISKNDPASKCVQIDFDVQQKGRSATNWSPVQVETTDATGNYVKGWINDYRQNGEKDGYFYQPGLWPNEPAWKVRLEFSRNSGFSDDELWSVTNVPVRPSERDAWSSYSGNPRNSGETSAPFAETTINGIHLKMFQALQYTSQMRNGKVVGIFFKTDPDVESAGMRMTPLTVTDGDGRELKNQGASWGGGNFLYEFPEAHNLESVNITIALHKSRFVEFTVKPTKQ